MELNKDMKNVKKKSKTIYAILLVGMMIAGFSSSIFLGELSQTDEKQELWDRIQSVREKLVVSATNGTSGSVTNGADTIVNVLIYPHQADTSVYNGALSEDDAYEHFDNSFTNGEELEGETPYDTNFDIILIMQYDKDHVYDTDWNATRVWCYCNESQLSISSQLMEEGSWYDKQADDGKINFYLQDSNGGAGSGFTISALEQIDDIEFKPYAQY